MTASQKEREQWALDRFLALLKGPAPDPIEPNEEPDFVLTFGSRRVGIEMTDLYLNQPRAGRPRQEQESLRWRVVKTAEQLYADRGLPPVHVSVHFNTEAVLEKTAVRRLATQMVDWAAARIPRAGASFEEECDWVNRAYFPEQLHALRVYRHDWMSSPRFSAPDADYVPDLTVDDVRRTLKRKNARRHAYLRKCDEVWLVVNLNADRLSMTFEIGDAITQTAYDTPFARVFLLEHMTQHLSELNRAHGDPPAA